MRYVVTGGAGHLGGALVEALLAREETEGVTVADLQRPAEPIHRAGYEFVDVRDGQRMSYLLERDRPDAVVHLAYAHDQSGGRQAMYETNIVGTNGVLAAAAAAGTPHVIAMSSAACYEATESGAPVGEGAALRSDIESELVRDRATVDRLCQLWAARQPDRTMTVVRPCALLTSAPADRVAALFTQPPYAASLGRADAAVQFLHEDDLVDALATIASGRHGGVFNLAGEGVVELGECARLVGLKSRGATGRVYSKLRTRNGSRASLEDLELLVGTPPLATERIATAAGWRPSRTSSAAFEAAMGRRGKLVAAAAAAAV